MSNKRHQCNEIASEEMGQTIQALRALRMRAKRVGDCIAIQFQWLPFPAQAPVGNWDGMARVAVAAAWRSGGPLLALLDESSCAEDEERREGREGRGSFLAMYSTVLVSFRVVSTRE